MKKSKTIKKLTKNELKQALGGGRTATSDGANAGTFCFKWSPSANTVVAPNAEGTFCFKWSPSANTTRTRARKKVGGN